VRSMAVKLSAGAGRNAKIVRWFEDEILALRERRIALSRANAETIRQKVVAQNARRAARQRLKATTENHP